MSSLIKRSTPRTPAISAPVTSTTPEVSAAAEAEALRLKKKRGYASTILSGKGGVPEEAQTQKETLG